MKNMFLGVITIFLLATGFVSCNQKSSRDTTVIHLQNTTDSTKYYTYTITFPDSITSQMVADSLQQMALSTKSNFMNMFPADTTKFYTTPWQMIFKSKKVMQSARFEAYDIHLYLYTGGAHGMPSVNTLTLDRKRNEFVELRDMLQDTTALKPISRYAINQIASKIYEKTNIDAMSKSNRDWVIDGAAPLLKNYATTRPAQPENNVATGIDVIFGAYQVGSYAMGMPRIFIPDSVFHKYLKPEYQSAFNSAE